MHLHELFLRTLWVLRDYLPDLVIADGRALYIGAIHPERIAGAHAGGPGML